MKGDKALEAMMRRLNVVLAIVDPTRRQRELVRVASASTYAASRAGAGTETRAAAINIAYTALQAMGARTL